MTEDKKYVQRSYLALHSENGSSVVKQSTGKTVGIFDQEKYPDHKERAEKLAKELNEED